MSHSGPGTFATTYDEVPYGVTAHPASHPDRLATVATLFGAAPARVATSRVLELGCARGGNLIPLAVALPGASFVGVDLSAGQINDAQVRVAALGLSNVELRHNSIMDIDQSFGLFDYVICHGVFAWVPPDVQDKILRVCAENLNPNGVAFISYNTYPGWHFRGMIREMLLYHSDRFTDAGLRMAASRELLAFLAGAAGDTSPYGRILNEERDLLGRLPDYYLFHEHLEANNRPMYVHQFIERAAAHGLRYLGDADPPTMGHFTLPPKVQNVLRRLAGDVAQAEQYMDFLRNRMFRQSLIVKEAVALTRTLDSTVLHSFRVASSATADDADASSFRSKAGETIATGDPMASDALRLLAERWPDSIAFDELVDVLVERHSVGADAVAGALGASFLRLYLSSRVIELHTAPSAFTVEVHDRPVASPYARMQAGNGVDVTNLRHETVKLGDVERQILLLLDGSRSQPDILAAMHDLLASGRLVAQRDGQAVRDPSAARALIDASLAPILERFARAALLLR